MNRSNWLIMTGSGPCGARARALTCTSFKISPQVGTASVVRRLCYAGESLARYHLTIFPMCHLQK
jgi:hypothetical protein